MWDPRSLKGSHIQKLPSYYLRHPSCCFIQLWVLWRYQSNSDYTIFSTRKWNATMTSPMFIARGMKPDGSQRQRSLEKDGTRAGEAAPFFRALAAFSGWVWLSAVGSQLSVTPVLGDPSPLLYSSEICMHMLHPHICLQQKVVDMKSQKELIDCLAALFRWQGRREKSLLVDLG